MIKQEKLLGGTMNDIEKRLEQSTIAKIYHDLHCRFYQTAKFLYPLY